MAKARALGAVMVATALIPRAHAQSFADPVHFQQQAGAALYRAACEGCHMPDGKGAKGAGAYPALAANERLSQAGYPVLVVLAGRNGMPGFAAMLTDAQVAAVVTYVRTHFGNAYSDAVTPADVAGARQK